MSETQQPTITFKPTTQGYSTFTCPYSGTQTVLQLKELIAQHYTVEYEQIKLIFKGKVLSDKQTCQQAKVSNSVIMLVISKQTEKPKPTNVDNTVHKIPSSFNTGMGGGSPVGFGAYSMINHPQYMSAISGAVNEENIEDLMNDPQYSSMMEDMLKDPDTIKYMIEQNPMLKNMLKQNPGMKMILDNPQLMKMAFNPETMKMARQAMKNGNVPMQQGQQGQFGGMGGLGGLGGMGGFGGFGGLGGLGGLGGMGGMGGFNFNGAQLPQQSQNPQQQFQNPFFQNPYMMNPLFNQFSQANQPVQVPQQPVQIPIEQKYKSQLKQLQSMGFQDREQSIKALIESKGDVDGAIERLCKD